MPAEILDRAHDKNAELAPFGHLAGTEDMDLVAAAKSGSNDAFEVLVGRHARKILRVAQGVIGNREDAEDIVQQSLQQAYVHLHRFEGRSSFSTWLTRIAINQSLMELRTSRSRELHLDRVVSSEDAPFRAEFADDTPTPEQRYSQKELQRILTSAMHELPTNLRTVLQLREVEEQSTEETARMLGLSISAVKSRIRRGRQKLRQALTRHFPQRNVTEFSKRNSV